MTTDPLRLAINNMQVIEELHHKIIELENMKIRFEKQFSNNNTRYHLIKDIIRAFLLEEKECTSNEGYLIFLEGLVKKLDGEET